MPADPRRRFASLLILGLAAVLTLAFLPYASGLFGAPVLYMLWQPFQRVLVRRMPAPLAASIILFLTFLLIVVPGVWLITLLVGQAQSAAQTLFTSPLLERLQTVRLGPIEVGPVIVQLGQNLITWIGNNAFDLIGTAARFALNVVFTFFGLYFLLVNPGTAWAKVVPYVPFSRERAHQLGDRFKAVTYSTVIGTGVNALVQGALMGVGLAVAGVPNPLFWGAVTMVLSILPVVGSGMVWLPASISLFLGGRVGAGVGLLLWGALVVANIDNLLRPYIYRRFAQIHPMITLVGAIVGVEYFGLVGLVLGPLGIQYFFELLRMFGEEYGPTAAPSEAPADPAPASAPGPPVPAVVSAPMSQPAPRAE